MLAGRHHRLIVNCARQWGKSTVAAAKALHVALFRPDSLVVVSSPTARQSALFIHKVQQFVRKLGIRPRRDGQNVISVLLPNGSRIVGLPGASEDNIRGFSAASLLIVDEAARVDDAVYHSARPILAASGGDMWLLSTPKGKRGFFYNNWVHGGDTWDRISVPATECPRIPAAHLEHERREMGDDWFSQEYLCGFVDLDGGVFHRDLIDAAFSKEVRLLGDPCGSFAPLRETLIGVDLGQKHDSTAISVLQVVQSGHPYHLVPSTTSYHLRHLDRVPLGTSYPRIVERICELARHPELQQRCSVVVDGTGVGAPVVDMLRQSLDCSLVAVTITGARHAGSAGGYSTVPKRDLIQNLELMLEDEELRIAPNLAERKRLVEEMMCLRMNTTQTGHETYGATARQHDDLVLAVALACWGARRSTTGHQQNRLL